MGRGHGTLNTKDKKVILILMSCMFLFACNNTSREIAINKKNISKDFEFIKCQVNPVPEYWNYSYPYNNPSYYDDGTADGTYGYTQEGKFFIPNDASYFISGYNRAPYYYSNGQPMVSRIPIISGNYSYPTYIANKLVHNSYVSMATWCDSNLLTRDEVQGYFLNAAYIQNVNSTDFVLMVNCALKKKGIIDGNVEFRVSVDIRNNRFIWRKLSNVVENDEKE